MDQINNKKENGFLKMARTLAIALPILLAALFMTFSIVQLKAAESKKSVYDDPNLPLEDVMVKYHTYVNDTFNDSTKKMLTALEKKPNDLNGQPFFDEKREKPYSADDCLKHPENYSTFCLATRLIGGDEGGRGYLNYKKALENRQDQLFDTATEKDAWNKWIEATTCAGITTEVCNEKKKEQLNQKFQGVYQSQKALEVSGRLDAINREIIASKEALDKTLAAYDQLRWAWPLHRQYKSIFEALVTYRDKLIEVRGQTDQYPSRFVDVTTAKCF